MIPDTAAVNPSGKKTLLAKGINTLFINGYPAVVNGLRKLGNAPSEEVFFLLVSSNKISLYSKDLITFIISFISFFLRVLPEP